MARAFQIATTGRPGPVRLNLPLDLLKDRCSFTPSDLEVDERYGELPSIRSTPPAEVVAAGVDALLAACHPIILAGGGAVGSGAMDEVRRLAKLLDIPVATTLMGKGTMAKDHLLVLGPFGLIGWPCTNVYVLQADLAVAIGFRFTDVDTAGWRFPARCSRIIQIDMELTQFGRNHHVDMALPGDIRAVLGSMLEIIESRGRSAGRTSQREDVSSPTTR